MFDNKNSYFLRLYLILLLSRIYAKLLKIYKHQRNRKNTLQIRKIQV